MVRTRLRARYGGSNSIFSWFVRSVLISNMQITSIVYHVYY